MALPGGGRGGYEGRTRSPSRVGGPGGREARDPAQPARPDLLPPPDMTRTDKASAGPPAPDVIRAWSGRRPCCVGAGGGGRRDWRAAMWPEGTGRGRRRLVGHGWVVREWSWVGGAGREVQNCSLGPVTRMAIRTTLGGVDSWVVGGRCGKGVDEGRLPRTAEQPKARSPGTGKASRQGWTPCEGGGGRGLGAGRLIRDGRV